MIVMMFTVEVDGRNFLANRQYEYTAKVSDTVTASGVDKKDKGAFMIHYVVNVDGVDYKIPFCSCVEYDVAIPEEQQNKQKYIENTLLDKTENWMGKYKEVTGIQINNNAGADIDLRRYKALLDANEGIHP